MLPFLELSYTFYFWRNGLLVSCCSCCSFSCSCSFSSTSSSFPFSPWPVFSSCKKELPLSVTTFLVDQSDGECSEIRVSKLSLCFWIKKFVSLALQHQHHHRCLLLFLPLLLLLLHPLLHYLGRTRGTTQLNTHRTEDVNNHDERQLLKHEQSLCLDPGASLPPLSMTSTLYPTTSSSSPARGWKCPL